MMDKLSRRALLSGAASTFASASFANAPLLSLRPVARSRETTPPPAIRPEARIETAEIIRRSQLGGRVGFVVADVATGDILVDVDGDVPLPPASVTKSVTALYALESLGPDYRYRTRVLADGPIVDGVLNGNLILAGGGDPLLVTDQLASLAQRIKDTGLREVKGEFYVWGEALARVEEIDGAQLDHLGYNPAVSGLNLNFNRVHFEWKRVNGEYIVTMDARSNNYRPEVSVARMEIVDRTKPVFSYIDGGQVDRWTVARGALGNAGSRWLPVRYPALYAGEVLRIFLRSHGIVLAPPKRRMRDPEGVEIATHEAVPLQDILRDMLRYSTNLTAEVAGLTATRTRTDAKRGLRTSALTMTRWAAMRASIGPTFVDHSGLGDESRITAHDMVRFMGANGVARHLFPILKTTVMTDENRKQIRDFPAQVHAKTGTLNFVSSLAGYIVTGRGRQLTFAFFAADLDARNLGKRRADEQPPGAAQFNAKAKRLQQELLQRWALIGDF